MDEEQGGALAWAIRQAGKNFESVDILLFDHGFRALGPWLNAFLNRKNARDVEVDSHPGGGDFSLGVDYATFGTFHPFWPVAWRHGISFSWPAISVSFCQHHFAVLAVMGHYASDLSKLRQVLYRLSSGQANFFRNFAAVDTVSGDFSGINAVDRSKGGT